jgi:hypothetical protein
LLLPGATLLQGGRGATCHCRCSCALQLPATILLLLLLLLKRLCVLITSISRLHVLLSAAVVVNRLLLAHCLRAWLLLGRTGCTEQLGLTVGVGLLIIQQALIPVSCQRIKLPSGLRLHSCCSNSLQVCICCWASIAICLCCWCCGAAAEQAGAYAWHQLHHA